MSISELRGGNVSLNRATRLAGLILLGMILLCSGTGIIAAWQQSAALERQSAAGALFANHELADMMHDAIRSDVLAAFESQDPAANLKRADIESDFRDHVDALKKGIAADGAYTGSADVAAVTSKLVKPMEAYAASASEMMAIAWSDPIAAKAKLPAFFEAFRQLETAMGDASDAINAHAKAQTDWATTIGNIAMIALVIITLLGAAGSMMMMQAVRRRVVAPIESLALTMDKLGGGDLHAEVTGTDRGDELGEMARAMLSFRDQLAAAEAAKQAQTTLIVDSLGTGLGALADGDLTTSISAELTGPFARLKSDFNDAVSALRGLIGTVSESAGNLRQGSGEIAHAAEDLARRTQANAANLERTSTSVSEMDRRLKDTAAAASSTVERAERTIAVVNSGRSLAERAVESMNRVSASAEGIDSVIEGLDKIAFQTRVLAMNAAVEAGRAGEAGRGFAVVADLVSALAMRAEEEAKRARDQLTVTQADIVTAVDTVRSVDGAFADISGNVENVHELLGRMATDNQAQSAAISEINQTITTMDQSTQQNAAMVEETSAASRSLTEEVNQLAEQAARFKIGNAAPSSRRPAPKLPGAPVRDLPKAAVAALTVSSSGDGDWASF